MEKREAVLTVIENANKAITSTRVELLKSIELMLEGSITHTFDKASQPHITDEEECVRLGAKSCTKDTVTLSDGSEMDLGDVGTDDLYSIVDALHTELYVQYK